MHRQDALKTYPVTYPKNVTLKCHSVTISWAGAWATPGGYVYLHRLLHRLGHRLGNHRQLPFGSIQWVTDMPPTMHDRHAVYDSRRVTDRR